MERGAWGEVGRKLEADTGPEGGREEEEGGFRPLEELDLCASFSSASRLAFASALALATPLFELVPAV